MTAELQTKTQHLHHFIGGEFVAAAQGKTFETINPATGEVLAQVALGTADDIDRAAKAAHHAFQNGPWPRMSVKERCAVLKKIGDLILEKKDILARAETLDSGKPISESGEGDIPRSALNFHFFADFAQTIGEDLYTVSDTERHFASREPLGVVGLITPWNLPLYLATWKIAPALAMGNTCIVKPAEWTPYTAYLLADIVRQAGLPEGVLNIVQGFGAGGAGEALTRHELVRAISFTGETSTGKAIMAAAAGSLKKVSFELGGKGANILFADADLSEALPTAVRAAFRNQGEICLAGSRLFVHEKIYNQVVEEMVERVKSIKVGDPLDASTQMGALISREHMEKVESYLKMGKAEGKLLTGGERIKGLEKGNFLSPAIFTGLPYDSRFCQEEIFGPALPIIPFKTDEEAVVMANSTPYGLSASIWSKDVDRCHNVSKRLRSGMIWVNCWFARDLRTPFGGQKLSGVGREGGRYSLEFFCDAKTVSYKYKG
ncbi:MAG TPA: aldehyde dehydrogenase [Planktothrix sp.]|jgi:aminomuconate-semialdehyde/2-hydroxymuconate-6-semialdehyde dehydrogenase